MLEFVGHVSCLSGRGEGSEGELYTPQKRKKLPLFAKLSVVLEKRQLFFLFLGGGGLEELYTQPPSPKNKEKMLLFFCAKVVSSECFVSLERNIS